MRKHFGNSVQSIHSRMSRLLWCVSLSLLFIGCSSSKFTATTRVDLTPFADQTIALVGQTDSGLFQAEAPQVTPYIDWESPEVEAFATCRKQMFDFAQQMTNYSLKIAALSDAKISGPEQALAFADYIENLTVSIAVDEPEITPEAFQALLTDIRQQTTLLDAIRIAQPLLDERVLYGTRLFDRAEQLATTLRDQIETNIDARNAGLLRFIELIQKRKGLALQAMELIDSARPDQIEALKAALTSNKLDPADFFTFRNLSLDEALKIEQLLLNRLEIVEKMRRQVEPDLKAYYAAHEELDQVYRNFHGRLNTARVRVLIWSKAHQKMAAGVTDPAKWFDLTDITGELSEIAGNVIDRAL